MLKKVLTEVTPKKHSPLLLRALVEVNNQHIYGSIATHLHQSQPPPPTQEAWTWKCFKCKKPSYCLDKGWARKYINLVDENIKAQGVDDYEDEIEIAHEDDEHLSCVVKKLLYTSEENEPPQHNDIFQAFFQIYEDTQWCAVTDPNICQKQPTHDVNIIYQ